MSSKIMNEEEIHNLLEEDHDDNDIDITSDDSENDYDETATTADDDNDGDDNNNDDDHDFMQQGHGGKNVTYNVKGQFVYIEDCVRYGYETSTTYSF
jgi:hypothetical protein